MNDRHHDGEDFGCGLGESGVLLVPAGTVQVESVNIHTFLFVSGEREKLITY